MVARDMMSWTAVTIWPDMTLQQAAAILFERGFNALPVVDDDDEVMGVIGVRDLLTAPQRAVEGIAISDESDPAERLNLWKRLRVREVMTTEIISVSEDTPLMHITALMAITGAHPVLVLRDRQAIGTISRREVIKAILHASDTLYRPVAS